MANITTPSTAMAQRFFPTMSQLRGSLKRSSPKKMRESGGISDKEKDMIVTAIRSLRTERDNFEDIFSGFFNICENMINCLSTRNYAISCIINCSHKKLKWTASQCPNWEQRHPCFVPVQSGKLSFHQLFTDEE